MIGDRSYDVDAAHANAIRAIGVTWGIGDRAELEAAGADAIVERPAELLALLSRSAERPGPGLTRSASGGGCPPGAISPSTWPPKPPPTIRAPIAPASCNRATAASTARVETS